jgi:hypothetical protein
MDTSAIRFSSFKRNAETVEIYLRRSMAVSITSTATKFEEE